MKHTNKEVKEKLSNCTVKNNIFTVRSSFFYKMGKSADNLEKRVLEFFPDAKILDKGEVYKAFRGGQSVSQGSHWWVKFTFEE